MEHIGTVIIYIIMICAVIGAFGAIRNPEIGVGKEFMEGIFTIGPIFANSAGIMASIPFISKFIENVFGPFFNKIGADPAIAATSILATDMGGYQLADVLKHSYEGWIMAMIVGFMAGATIVFSIPLGLPMLDKRDHKYMALGILSGLLAIPFGVFISTFIILMSHMKIRTVVETTGAATHVFSISLSTVFVNLLPLIIFVVITAIGLYFFSDIMIKIFIIFGKVLDVCIKLVFVFSVVQIFTGFFTNVFGVWGFDPIMADKKDNFRALENAGNIAIMLSGAFPKLVKDMPPKDKVINIAFGVCSAFLLGDHLSYTANFQPTLIPAVMIGKFSAGVLAVIFAYFLCIPKARKLEDIDRRAGIIGPDEYLEKERLANPYHEQKHS
jgi:ethanolamine transporter